MLPREARNREPSHVLDRVAIHGPRPPTLASHVTVGVACRERGPDQLLRARIACSPENRGTTSRSLIIQGPNHQSRGTIHLIFPLVLVSCLPALETIIEPKKVSQALESQNVPRKSENSQKQGVFIFGNGLGSNWAYATRTGQDVRNMHAFILQGGHNDGKNQQPLTNPVEWNEGGEDRTKGKGGEALIQPRMHKW